MRGLLYSGFSSDKRTVTAAKAIGVWIPHQLYESNDYSSYICSVAQIEEWTGFDLFHNLPDTIEAAAEVNDNWSTFQTF